MQLATSVCEFECVLVCVFWGRCVCVCRGGQRNLAAKLSNGLQHLASSCEGWAAEGEGWADKDPLEGRLISAGRQTGRSAQSTPSQLEGGSLCQANCVLHFSFWIELQVASDSQHLCLSSKRVVPSPPCPIKVHHVYHFYPASCTKGRASYWYVRGCVVCTWDHFSRVCWWTTTSSEGKRVKSGTNKRWHIWKISDCCIF